MVILLVVVWLNKDGSGIIRSCNKGFTPLGEASCKKCIATSSEFKIMFAGLELVQALHD